jgi:hypothetical protein
VPATHDTDGELLTRGRLSSSAKRVAAWALTDGFGATAALATGIVALGLPLLPPSSGSRDPGAGRIAQGAWFVRNSLGQGIRDALAMLRSRPVGIILGSFGTMAFDLAAR